MTATVTVTQWAVSPSDTVPDGKEAAEQLRAMYPEEARNVALDIRTKLGELALQHQLSGQRFSASA